jgi:hypothetical protein
LTMPPLRWPFFNFDLIFEVFSNFTINGQTLSLETSKKYSYRNKYFP